jgi:hydrogenase maturation factor
LLLAVSADRAEALLKELQNAYPNAAVIAEVVERNRCSLVLN